MAAQHLQVIRTLMERSALYRRALAPVMICAGTLGSLAAMLAARMPMHNGSSFILYWSAVGAISVVSALLLTRRQALKQAEAFWSSPTRRVVQAMLPPFAAGALLGLLAIVSGGSPSASTAREFNPHWVAFIALPCVWTVLYGCAMHSAGFYTTRGMRLFGWILVVLGCAALCVVSHTASPIPRIGNGIMGFFFGGLHLAYGAYLYVTEPRRIGP